MYTIKGTKITLTKGDSFYCQIALKKNGNPYTPEQGDSIRFVMKKNYTDSTVVIEKTIPIDTMTLAIASADTKTLACGTYQYDMEITFADGDIDTFINRAEFEIVPEVG